VLAVAWPLDGDRWRAQPQGPIDGSANAANPASFSFDAYGMPCCVWLVLQVEPAHAKARAIWAQLMADTGEKARRWMLPLAAPSALPDLRRRRRLLTTALGWGSFRLHRVRARNAGPSRPRGARSSPCRNAQGSCSARVAIPGDVDGDPEPPGEGDTSRSTWWSDTYTMVAESRG
jgi:hypothetical protein